LAMKSSVWTCSAPAFQRLRKNSCERKLWSFVGTERSEEVSSDPEENGRWEHEMASEHPPSQRKMEGGLENGLANLMEQEENPRKAHAGRGQESKWEIPINISSDAGVGFNSKYHA